MFRRFDSILFYVLDDRLTKLNLTLHDLGIYFFVFVLKI